jgi:hypothetical protein
MLKGPTISSKQSGSRYIEKTSPGAPRPKNFYRPASQPTQPAGSNGKGSGNAPIRPAP